MNEVLANECIHLSHFQGNNRHHTRAHESLRLPSRGAAFRRARRELSQTNLHFSSTHSNLRFFQHHNFDLPHYECAMRAPLRHTSPRDVTLGCVVTIDERKDLSFLKLVATQCSGTSKCWNKPARAKQGLATCGFCSWRLSC